MSILPQDNRFRTSIQIQTVNQSWK